MQLKIFNMLVDRLTLIFVFIWLNQAESHEFFIANNYDRNYYICVTNSSFALTWNTKSLTKSLSQVSKYIPEIQQYFDTDITEQDVQFSNFNKKPWHLTNSLDSNVNKLILDRRWEDLDVFPTSFSTRKELKFYSALSTLKGNFEIPLSIRIEQEAHIFLCDGDHPSTSNCYWLLLQAWFGNKTVIRKCSAKTIPPLKGDFPDPPCSDELISVHHPATPQYLSSKKWSHFMLSKKEKHLTFSHILGHKNENKILDFMDSEEPISVTHMFIHSKNVNGLWKIHNVDFIYTTEASDDVHLGPIMHTSQNYLCIALYIAMCKSCKMTLTVTTPEQVFEKKEYYFQHSEWTEIKIVIENLTYQNSSGIRMMFSTVQSTNPDQFWAIDKFRLCQKEEYRSISISKEASCQLMSEDDDVISVTDRLEISDNTCPENTIGDFCVPCEWIGNCNQMQVCDKTKCVCAAGYRVHSRHQCYYVCDEPFFGHGCKKQCENCRYDSCKPTNGSCLWFPCKNNYTGLKCDIPPSLIFNKPPTVDNIGYTMATVVMTNSTISKGLGTDQPQNYNIEYKKATDKTWKIVGWQHQIHDNKPIFIDNLEAETEYFVRSVIISETGKIYNDHHVKVTKFITTCDDITVDNIDIRSTSTTAIISILASTNLCTLSTYSVSAETQHSIEKKPTLLSNGSYYFNNLNPFTFYNLIFQNNFRTINKTFVTPEGVPEIVQDFSIINRSSSSIQLHWQAPKLNGNLKHYVIEYRQTSYIACNTQLKTIDPKKIEQKETFVTLEYLTPFSSYLLSVYAVNTNFKGPPSILRDYTMPLKHITSEEIPQIKGIVRRSYETELQLEINCQKVRGSLSIQASAICTNEWCPTEKTVSIINNNIVKNPSILFSALTPFSDYKLKFRFCRSDNSNCTEVYEDRKFQTKSAAPGPVTDLLVYSKNTNSISIRWKPPYPPHGILKDYEIEYRLYRNSNRTKIDVTSCKLWPDFHCAKLSDLKKNRYYSLTVYPRNEDPLDFGDPQTVPADTKTEPSLAPCDLTVTWTAQNDLELEWKHPNQTNGDIEYFEISLDQGLVFMGQLPIVNNTYNLTYYYKVMSEKMNPTTKYTISVLAFNGFYGISATKFETSPPDIPKLDKEIQATSSNNMTASVTISPKRIRGKTDNYRMILLITSEESNLDQYPELNQFNLKKLNVIFNCTIYLNDPIMITIGNKKRSANCSPTENLPLKPGTSYNITTVLINNFKNTSRFNVYSIMYTTNGMPEMKSTSSLFGLLALLLLILIAAIIYIKRDKVMLMKNSWFERRNTSFAGTEGLESHQDQISLSNLPQDLAIQAQNKNTSANTSNDPKMYSKLVKITEIEEYVKESIKNGELERQHALFPRGQTKPCIYGSLKENKSKNRYNNLIAYDHTRVTLQKINDDPHSDYINANHIDGYKVRRAYIATQGPKASTLDDFWRMIWQENVRYIAMVANVYENKKKKVEKYWPEINQALHFGNITVQHISQKVFADYEHRIFTVTHNKETRKVDQLHFSSWPDHGIPLYSQSLVPFLQKMLQLPLSSKSPILVHCSAGVGRTGTILLCDICLRMAAAERSIDALKYLQLLREQRANMVDNIEQYTLAHLVILECLVGLQTSISCSEIEESVQKLSVGEALTLQMRYLKDTQWQDQVMKAVGQVEEVPIIKEKNRFENIIPEIQGRVFISRYPTDDESSTYINAVTVDGFRSPGHFIVTQQPMPNTLGDFWRLVNDRGLSVIISLNKINCKDKTSCNFWPTNSEPQMTPVPHITLKHVDTQISDFYSVIIIHSYENSRKEHLPITIVSMDNWPPKTKCPKDMEKFLTFWKESNSIARRSNPVLITCYDGVKASGLYVALTFIIEKMKLEQVCDVCQAVRTVRHNREQFVQDLEQFQFLYEAAVLYINGFESYANFI